MYVHMYMYCYIQSSSHEVPVYTTSNNITRTHKLPWSEAKLR